MNQVDATSQMAYEATIFGQWEEFARISKMLRIVSPVLAAVYYRRKDALVMPGANLRRLPKDLDSSSKLFRFLADVCPHPDADDKLAAASIIRHFDDQPKLDRLSLAIPMGDHRSFEMQGCPTLNWPRKFLPWVTSAFRDHGPEYRSIGLGAFPLRLCGPDNIKTQHVAFIYVGLKEDFQAPALADSLPELTDQLETLRTFLAWGVQVQEAETRLLGTTLRHKRRRSYC